MTCQVAAQADVSRASVGIEYGIWKPSSLDDYASQPLKNIDGAEPYWGLTAVLPPFKSHALRLSIMQWQQNDLPEVGLASVTLRHLSADLKYVVLPQTNISPYASYGVAAIWSRERPVGSEDKKIPLDRAGWGLNLGAGIDFQLHQRWALGIEYQYLYAMFPKRVGLTDNYSGPKLAARLLFLL